jgi:hypothetical protein
MPDTYQPPQGFRTPTFDVGDVRAASGESEGGESYALRKRREFEASNPGLHRLQALDDLAQEQLKPLRHELGRVLRKLKWTRPTRPLEVWTVLHKVPLFHVVWAVLVLLLAGGGIWMGNTIGADYVVASGLDFYAIDPDGAKVFMGALIMAGVMAKLADRLFDTDSAKTWYARIIFAIGALAAVTWCCATAWVFAPDPSGGLGQFTGDTSGPGRLTTIVLIFSHLVVDLTGGFAAIWGAEKILLAGHAVADEPNPRYAHWVARKQALEQAIRLIVLDQADARDRMQSHADTAEAIELEARDVVSQAGQVAKSSETAALAASRLSFLKKGKE